MQYLKFILTTASLALVITSSTSLYGDVKPENRCGCKDCRCCMQTHCGCFEGQGCHCHIERPSCCGMKDRL